MQPIVERLLNNVSEPCEWEGHRIMVKCSIGVALYPRDGADLDTLLNKADATMYRVKQRGRGDFLFHAEEPVRRGRATPRGR
ncbi:Phytochrome-like protein cph2 [compost metagenome]